jgi:hypothetical protein
MEFSFIKQLFLLSDKIADAASGRICRTLDDCVQFFATVRNVADVTMRAQCETDCGCCD